MLWFILHVLNGHLLVNLANVNLLDKFCNKNSQKSRFYWYFGWHHQFILVKMFFFWADPFVQPKIISPERRTEIQQNCEKITHFSIFESKGTTCEKKSRNSYFLSQKVQKITLTLFLSIFSKRYYVRKNIFSNVFYPWFSLYSTDKRSWESRSSSHL